MCGRYYVASEDQTEELRAIIEELQRRAKEPVKTGEVFPSETAPVIANNRAGKPMPFRKRWVGRASQHTNLSLINKRP